MTLDLCQAVFDVFGIYLTYKHLDQEICLIFAATLPVLLVILCPPINVYLYLRVCIATKYARFFLNVSSVVCSFLGITY